MNFDKQLRQLMDQVPDSLWVTDTKFNILYINKSIEVYGWKRKDLIGKNISYFAPVETVEACYAAKERYKKDPINNVKQKLIVDCNFKGSADIYTVEVNVTVFKNDGKVVGYCGSSRDITQDLINKKMVEENIKLKSMMEICGGLSHEVSQPLTSIGGTASLLQMTNKDPELVEYIELLVEQSERANDLIHKLQSAKKYKTKKYMTTEIMDMNSI